MEKQEINTEKFYTIDVMHILKSLWKRAWLIVLCGLLSAAIAFSVSAYTITPTYSSYIKLYVNNNSFSLGSANFSITAADLTAAQSLLKTYGEILKSRSTLERIIEKSNIKYSWKQLSGMIRYEAANETEIMRVTVTCGDPYEACNIANTIAEVLPERISEILEGSSMVVVDSAIPDTTKVAPNITGYTTKGLAIGVLISAALLVVLAILDDTIHDEEYVLRTYDYPILGRIPDLLNTGNKSYGYRYQTPKKPSN